MNFNYRVLGAPNDSFILDVKRTGGVKAFSCEICSKVFKFFWNFKDHMMRDHEITNYKCNSCLKVLALDIIEHHMVTGHIGKQISNFKFKCELSKYIRRPNASVHKEMYSYSLIAHGGYRLILLKDNTKDPRFKCEVCNCNEKDENVLREHIIDKHLFSVFKCLSCNFIVDFDDFEKHLKVSHDVHEKVSVFKCVDANGFNGIVADTKFSYSFVEKNENQFNLILSIDKKKSRFCCEKCKCNFGNESDLKIHIKEIHNVENFNCQRCKFEIKLDSLDQHAGSHGLFENYFLFTSIFTKDKEIVVKNNDPLSYILCENERFELNLFFQNKLKNCFDCSSCIMQFDDEIELQEHMKDAHLITSFECTICQKDLSFKKLDSHSRNHSKEDSSRFLYNCIGAKMYKIHRFYFNFLEFSTGHFLRITNKIIDTDIFECSKCHTYLATLDKFWTHIFKEHNFKKFECNLCKSEENSHQIVQHLRMEKILVPEMIYTFKAVQDDSDVKKLSAFEANWWSFSFGFANYFLDKKTADPKYSHIFVLKLWQKEIKTFVCRICNIHFSSVMELRSHLVVSHYCSETYLCSVCKKVEFFKYLNLGTHDHNRKELFFISNCMDSDISQNASVEVAEKICKYFLFIYTIISVLTPALTCIFIINLT